MLLDARLARELTMVVVVLVDLRILLGRGSSFSAAAPAAILSSVSAPSPSMLELETCVLGSFIFLYCSRT